VNAPPFIVRLERGDAKRAARLRGMGERPWARLRDGSRGLRFVDQADRRTAEGSLPSTNMLRHLMGDGAACPRDDARRRRSGWLVWAQACGIGCERMTVGREALGESHCDPQRDLGGGPQKLDERQSRELEGYELGLGLHRGAPRSMV